MPDKIRVRYPPSPTGEPHVGNIRTAIFNWLFARHSNGSFIVRIEDTDQARLVPGATETLLDTLRWLGLDWDEGPDVGGEYGPYIQSQRLELYRETAERLIEQSNAYRCYCTPEELAEMRKEQQRLKHQPGYDRRCRDLDDIESKSKEASGVQPVVRFKMPLDSTSSADDLVRGTVSFENRLVDDFVLLKSDGFPTYHLANVIDDHHMEISHVMRGEEWLSSLPRHVQLYKALGWEEPKFAHLPIILAPDRSKLSKRHGATSLLEYRQSGYLPHAIVNFLTLMGWSLDGETEIFSAEELTASFSIERVGKAGAIFSTDKLDWMNGYYIRQLSHAELADLLLDYWRLNKPIELPELPDRDLLIRIVPLIQERLKTLADAAPRIPFFVNPDFDYEPVELIQSKMDTAGTKQALVASLEAIQGLDSADATTMERTLRPLAERLGIKVGQLLGTIRVATTGLVVSPPLFESMEILGKERVVRDIERAIAKIERHGTPVN